MHKKIENENKELPEYFVVEDFSMYFVISFVCMQGYQHTSFNIESSVKSLDDLELNAPLLTDELIGIYDNDDLKVPIQVIYLRIFSFI